MTEPAPNVIAVAKEDMYREADLWDAQSIHIDDCAFQADHLTIEAYDVILFNEFLAEYNDVTRLFAKLCRQGALVTRGIAQTLRTVAETYEEADDQIRTQYDRI
ncbi:MAG: hypothetical protein IRY85_11330 [Micromonosporaceae bacterium]|nr:hypothetical protein [Micromonosporaceae bacterium]